LLLNILRDSRQNILSKAIIRKILLKKHLPDAPGLQALLVFKDRCPARKPFTITAAQPRRAFAAPETDSSASHFMLRG
jgi:hypothetical protein